MPDRGAGAGPDLLKTLVPTAALILEHFLKWMLLFVLGAEYLMLLVYWVQIWKANAKQIDIDATLVKV